METINITPKGMETPEGIERVNKAMEAQSHAIANVANIATEFFRQWSWLLDESVKRASLSDDAEDDLRFDLKQMREAIEERANAQEEFLKAVAGAPRPKPYEVKR